MTDAFEQALNAVEFFCGEEGSFIAPIETAIFTASERTGLDDDTVALLFARAY